MGRRAITIHSLATVPLAPALIPWLQFTPTTNPLTRILRRALSCGVTLLHSTIPGYVHITIRINLEFKLSFQTSDATEPQNFADIAAPDENPGHQGPVDEHELEADVAVIQDIVGGMPATPAPLLGSLYGIPEHHAP